jgi:hypothetical protein
MYIEYMETAPTKIPIDIGVFFTALLTWLAFTVDHRERIPINTKGTKLQVFTD